jgi:ethanolamine transporter EutH
MSHRLKLTLFVIAFNIIGFAEGYLLRGIELKWLVPIVLATAFGAVLLSRRWGEVGDAVLVFLF